MKIVLIFPPTADPTAPYISIPVLSAHLRTRGIRVVPIDANVEAYDSLFKRETLDEQLEKVSKRFDRLDRKPSLAHTEQLEYALLGEALRDCRDVPERIGEALSTLRDRQAFYDPESYQEAVTRVDGALQLISAAYAPLRIRFSSYQAPFSLLSAAEIAADSESDRNPFYPYYEGELIPRLVDERPGLIGFSLAYTSQVQPAYSLALMIRRKLPDAYLALGGPAATQLFCRIGDDRISEALHPFDSAVLFEGEEVLFQLIEEIGSGRHPRGIRLGQRTSDLSQLPAPDFDGLPLEKYLSPEPVLPYDATRGCYWGKCAFCRYGLTERGAAPYRERPGEKTAEHLIFLAKKYRSRIFYLSQDSISPHALVHLAETIIRRNASIRWATDARAEKGFTEQACERLKRGGALSISLGIESAAARILERIRKGIPIGVMRGVLKRLARNGIAAEGMFFTDFPTETYDEALQTLRLIDHHHQDLSLFICGTFTLTHGTAVAEDPEKYDIEEIWQVKGDRFGLALFYATKKPAKTGPQQDALERSIRSLSRRWLLRAYPWAGSLSTAHTLLWYDRCGPDIFKRLAEKPEKAVRRRKGRKRRTRYDPETVGAAAFRNEDRIWHELVYTYREVSRDLYLRLAGACPEARPSKIRSTKSEIRNKTPNSKSKT